MLTNLLPVAQWRTTALFIQTYIKRFSGHWEKVCYVCLLSYGPMRHILYFQNLHFSCRCIVNVAYVHCQIQLKKLWYFKILFYLFHPALFNCSLGLLFSDIYGAVKTYRKDLYGFIRKNSHWNTNIAVLKSVLSQDCFRVIPPPSAWCDSCLPAGFRWRQLAV